VFLRFEVWGVEREDSIEGGCVGGICGRGGGEERVGD
jgi:hypothetical protein